MKQFTLAPMLLCVLCVLCAGCGQSPTAPSSTTATTPPTSAQLLCASGQSNMGDRGDGPVAHSGLLVALQAVTHAQGWSLGSEPIEYWDEGAHGWEATKPFLVPACEAFIWWQGETPEIYGTVYFLQPPPGYYRGKLTDLLRRVRALTAPTLPVYVIQLAPQFIHTRAEQAAACSADIACTLVTTDDLTFPDGVHMDDAGYRILAQRIVGLVR